jgi:Protein of unknown function (DUF1064)
MGARWTLADVVAAKNRINRPQRREVDIRATPAPAAVDMPAQVAVPKRKRHNNQKVFYQGQKFDSKHELRVFQDLELQRAAGQIRAVVRQVSMPIAGSKRRIRLDFMIVENDGRVRWLDAKGHAEREWLLKRDLVQASCGIVIETC